MNNENTNNSKTYQLKLVLIGDSTVGKTSLLYRFIEGKFIEDRLCTICADFKTKSIRIDQSTIAKLTVWDTAGQEKYRAITSNYYRDANGVILIYDVCNKSTFKNLDLWLNDINNKNLRESISIILVANKIDLPNREISYEEGDDFAQKNNLLYCETSIKEGKNIEDVFDMITRDIIENNSNLEDDNDISMSLSESVKAVRDFKQNQADSRANCC